MLYVHADISDIRNVSVSRDPTGMACFNVKQVPGSLLYGMVVQFVDKRNDNSVTRVAVVNDDESVCIEDLPPGDYSISVGDLEAPLLSIDEGVTIEAENTPPMTTTSSKNFAHHVSCNKGVVIHLSFEIK